MKAGIRHQRESTIRWSCSVRTRGYHTPAGSSSWAKEPKKIVIPYEKNVQKYVAMPAMARKAAHRAGAAHGPESQKDTADITLGMEADAAAGEADSLPLNIIELNDTKIGIITSGICYQYVKEATAGSKRTENGT